MFLKQKISKIKKSKKSVYQMTVSLLMTVFLCSSLPIFAQEVTNENTDTEVNEDVNGNTSEEEKDKNDVDELNQEISEKRTRISELNQQSEVYKQNALAKQKEAASLKNEVYLLNNQIGLTNVDINTKETEIEKIRLEIEKVQKEIDEKKEIINDQKEQISEFIRIIYKSERKSYLEIALLNDSFSDFFNELKYLSEIETEIKKELDKFQVLKHDLEIKEEDLEGKRLELDDAKTVLESRKRELTEQIDYQSLLLEETENSEAEYEALLEELKQEAQQVQIEISSLERRVRAKLVQEEGEDYFGEFTGTLAWPINSRTVTCGFHCEGYPYEKWLGPHSGLDIAASQGSPVYAAGDGYVAIARRLDWTVDSRGRKRPAYNYINIIHNNEISTVYGHLSGISVTEGDFVSMGQVIGASGGLPGTAGAGVFSTGAHLHFEVRQVNENGIPVPVDPMSYLLY